MTAIIRVCCSSSIGIPYGHGLCRHVYGMRAEAGLEGLFPAVDGGVFPAGAGPALVVSRRGAAAGKSRLRRLYARHVLA